MRTLRRYYAPAHYGHFPHLTGTKKQKKLLSKKLEKLRNQILKNLERTKKRKEELKHPVKDIPNYEVKIGIFLIIIVESFKNSALTTLNMKLMETHIYNNFYWKDIFRKHFKNTSKILFENPSNIHLRIKKYKIFKSNIFNIRI